MKWWISDYDGTLTLEKNQHQISDEDVNFINEWTKENKFVIATGRGITDLDSIIKEKKLDVDYRITNNGAAMFYKDETIYELAIPLGVRQHIYESLKKLHKLSGIKLSDNSKSIEISGLMEETPRYESTIVLPYWFSLEDRFEEYIDEVLTNKDLNNIAIYAHPQDFEYIRSLIDGLEGTKVIHTAPFVLEIMHKDVSKYLGIKYLQEKYNIDQKDIYVSGDGDNDFEMLSSFENSFVMEHGTKMAIDAANTKIECVSDIRKYL